MREAGGLADAAGYGHRATRPGWKQEQLKHNPRLLGALRCSLHKSTLLNRLSIISKDAYFCEKKEKDHLITHK